MWQADLNAKDSKAAEDSNFLAVENYRMKMTENVICMTCKNKTQMKKALTTFLLF